MSRYHQSYFNYCGRTMGIGNICIKDGPILCPGKSLSILKVPGRVCISDKTAHCNILYRVFFDPIGASVVSHVC